MACKDCEPGSKRPSPHPGPRCTTHHRARRQKTRDDAWARRLKATYNLTPEQYWQLYKAQGGRCALCQRATGASRRLAVDHDHSCCAGPVSCGKCVRGLLCGTDNKMLGHFRDDAAAFLRAAAYLDNPPAKAVFKGVEF